MSLALIAPRAARAQASPFAALAVEAQLDSAGCVRSGTLREAVATAMGFDPFLDAPQDSDARVEVRVRVRAVGRDRLRVQAATRLRGAEVWAELPAVVNEAAHCRTLLRVLATQIHGELRTAPSPTPPRPSTPSPTPSVSPPQVIDAEPAPPPQLVEAVPAPPPVVPSPPARPSAPVHLVLWAGGVGSYGRTPNVAPGLALGLAATHRRFAFGAELRWDLGGSSGATARDFEASAIGGSLLVCGVPHTRWWLCATGYVGAYRAKGQGDLPEDTRESLFYLLGGRVAHAVPIVGGLRLLLFAELTAAPTRVRVEVAAVPRWTMPEVQGSLGGALDVTIL